MIFKLDKFTEMQVRAKVNPDAESSMPLKHRSSVSGCPARSTHRRTCSRSATAATTPIAVN
jgi:hypothetical protein